MANAALVDANILVYTMDESEPAKLERSLRVLDELRSRRLGVLSTQILAEFFSAVTRRIKNPVPAQDAEAQLTAYSQTFPVYDITLPIVLEAARGTTQHQMSYWDAQVWATAKLNQIPYVLTENMQGHETLEGIRFLNPLGKDFDVSLITGRH